MLMKLIELESSLTPFICAHFRFVYVMRSAMLNPPVSGFVTQFDGLMRIFWQVHQFE